MVKINLFTYYIKLIDVNTDKEVNLSNIKYTSLNPEDIPKSLIQILYNFLLENQDSFYKKENKNIYIKKFSAESNKIYGEFHYGTHGSEHIVKNIKNDEDERKIEKDQSVLTPYYFYIEIPSNTKEGLLILENKSNDGVKGLFEEWLGNFVKKCTHTNLKLEVKKFMPKQIIDTYLNRGVLKKIRFVSYTLPSDELDILNGYGPEDGYAELKFQINKEKRKSIIPKIKTLIKNNNNESKNYSDIIGKNLKTDDIKLEIDLNGSERTFSINN